MVAALSAGWRGRTDNAQLPDAPIAKAEGNSMRGSADPRSSVAPTNSASSGYATSDPRAWPAARARHHSQGAGAARREPAAATAPAPHGQQALQPAGAG